MADRAGTAEIERALAANEEIRALVQELDAELSANYPPEQRHGLGLDAIFKPHIRFFVARVNGKPMGCGGVALFADFAEVKRMYVRPEARGNGVADAIMAQLAAETLGAGLKVLRLETGTEQIAAMRFYERSGFRACGPFEPYSSMTQDAIAASVFMEKPLSVA